MQLREEAFYSRLQWFPAKYFPSFHAFDSHLANSCDFNSFAITGAVKKSLRNAALDLISQLLDKPEEEVL